MSDASGENLKFERVLRHGDVIVFKLKETGDSARAGQVATEAVLAYGEVTGHAHRLRGDLELYESEAPENAKRAPGAVEDQANPSRMLFRVRSSATLTHEEHDPIVLESGLYLKVNQVEFDPFARMIRDVQD